MNRSTHSDHNNAWDDDEEGPDGDDDFDYDEFVENEFGGGIQRSKYSPFVRITAFIMLVILVFLTLIQFGF